MRIIQITDTHLSRGKAHFLDNWAPLAQWITTQCPDLVIHTGDVTIDGADVEDDLAYASRLLRDLGVRVRAVPGNHDVGEAGHHRQPVNHERLARWRRHFGPDWWFEDIGGGAGGWRLIGLDALILGSGSSEAAAQARWFEAAMNGADSRRIAWFLHKPLFLDSPDEGDTGYWSVKPEPRAWLMALVRRHRVALVGSGHLHKAHDFGRDGTRYLWAPASSFLVGEMQPGMPGEKRLGAARYELDGEPLGAEIVEVPGLSRHWLDDVIAEVYPRPPASADTG
ncbi:MAG TPA: metallophosphoesterase [Stellaceae bacterium]|jgi:3',5'-cyclic AMP phosphodiesterase CpdA